MQNYSQTKTKQIQHRSGDDTQGSDFTNWDAATTRNELQQYLDLGLVPIPLSGKIPLVRWKHWQPDNIAKLEPYIKPGINWGIKTGPRLTVIDFDSKETFIKFAVKNIDKLPANIPIVRTGRGYHIWLKPKRAVRNQPFEGIDIKGNGGYIVAPPSIHSNGNHYHFINPFSGLIPKMDLEELDFSGITRQKHVNAYGLADRAFPTDSWEPEPTFDWGIYKDGVNEGQRHDILVRYLGWLISRGCTRDEIAVLATAWNRKNRPPLGEVELSDTIESCWESWSIKNVPIKTLSKNRVIIGTKFSSAISQQYTQYADGGKSPTIEDWEVEIEPGPLDFCGYKSRIVRNGKVYIPISIFCGRWDCPRCSAHFRKRWLKHIINKAEEKDLYMISCKKEDWGCLRRRIHRYKANYVRIASDGNLTILIDQPLKGFDRLPNENLEEFLEKVIPTTADSCPISTSRRWERTKNTKSESGYKLVINTWLPREEQAEIAEALGADIISYEGKTVKHDPEYDIYHYVKWKSPEDIDEELWENQFIEAIWSREEEKESNFLENARNKESKIYIQ